MSGPAYTNELNIISEKILGLVDIWVRDYFHNTLYQKTVTEIKGHYETSLNNGERVFAISHSQGGLFMRDAFATVTFPEKLKYFAGFQIASPLNGVMNSYFGYATHGKDRLINTLRSFFGALPWNIEAPLFVSNSFEGISDYVVDFIINHGIVTTYLNDPSIKPKVISELIKTAQLLESNCSIYTPNGNGFAQIVDSLKPIQTKENILDYDVLTSGMDANTKANLRFKFLVYPSQNENQVAGIENVSVTLSGNAKIPSTDGIQPPTPLVDTLWSGDGSEPGLYEFLIDFKRFDPLLGKQIHVNLFNAGEEKTVPVYTTVIPEIKKRICYSGPNFLRATFDHIADPILSDYPKVTMQVIPSGQCRDIYLAYNTFYFYEFLVSADPNIYGYVSNWDPSSENGFVYNYKVYNANPWNLTGTFATLNGDKIISLKWEETAPDTIIIRLD